MLMKRITYVLPVLFAAMLVGGPALADKPAGKGKGAKHEQADKHEKSHDKVVSGSGFFEERHRTVTHDYYGQQFSRGRCPPGLAKKHNGCMPPGQAKKWNIGQPLARDVVYYDLPRPLVLQLGQPPSGHRYVRVASDILLIALGTGMVVDGLRDLGRI
jgi:Ni/Co efflux regulator RcnB